MDTSRICWQWKLPIYTVPIDFTNWGTILIDVESLIKTYLGSPREFNRSTENYSVLWVIYDIPAEQQLPVDQEIQVDQEIPRHRITELPLQIESYHVKVMFKGIESYTNRESCIKWQMILK